MLLALIFQAPVDPGILHWDGFASLGVGGVLAGMMFFFYRQDRVSSEAHYRQDRASSEARLMEMGEEFRSIVTANTTAMVELANVMRAARHSRERE